MPIPVCLGIEKMVTEVQFLVMFSLPSPPTFYHSSVFSHLVFLVTHSAQDPGIAREASASHGGCRDTVGGDLVAHLRGRQKATGKRTWGVGHTEKATPAEMAGST